MAKIETLWLGGQRSEVTHTQSGTKILTDAPIDNKGRGEYFSPTDLVATALGSCIITMMDAYATQHGIDLTGTRLVTDKIMEANPRRIGEIKIDLYIPGKIEPRLQKALMNAAHTCPVGKSLHPDLKQNIVFHFEEGEE